MFRASVAPSIWCENSLQRRTNVLSWTPREGLAIIISSITGNETWRLHDFHWNHWEILGWLGQRQLLLNSGVTEPRGNLRWLHCRQLFSHSYSIYARGKEERRKSNCHFFIFYIIGFNTYDRLNMISDLNNKFVNILLEFWLLEVWWEGR